MRLSTGRRGYKNSVFFQALCVSQERGTSSNPSNTDQEEYLSSILLSTEGSGCNGDEANTVSCVMPKTEHLFWTS